MPKAEPRLPGGNTLATDPKARAGIAADPAACRARPVMSTAKLGASAQTREPAAKTRRAREKVRRRLKKSESLPYMGIPVANTRE